ncbi:MAG: hypothetical protein ACRDJC_12545 [Thermomicrobiales bacterium]
MTGDVTRRVVLRAALAAVAAVPGITSIRLVEAHRHHKRHRKRCRQRCTHNRKTCDRACAILDDDSEAFCKQGCRIGQSQCRANC